MMTSQYCCCWSVSSPWPTKRTEPLETIAQLTRRIIVLCNNSEYEQFDKAMGPICLTYKMTAFENALLNSVPKIVIQLLLKIKTLI